MGTLASTNIHPKASPNSRALSSAFGRLQMVATGCGWLQRLRPSKQHHALNALPSHQHQLIITIIIVIIITITIFILLILVVIIINKSSSSPSSSPSPSPSSPSYYSSPSLLCSKVVVIFILISIIITIIISSSSTLMESNGYIAPVDLPLKSSGSTSGTQWIDQHWNPMD